MEVWTKNILNWLIEGQTHSGIPRVAKTSLALNEPVALYSIQKLPASPIELIDNSLVGDIKVYFKHMMKFSM